jgi:hypothetical protein
MIVRKYFLTYNPDMERPWFIEPFVDKGLGNSAYLIGSHHTKKGILIDPLRDVDQYLQARPGAGSS